MNLGRTRRTAAATLCVAILAFAFGTAAESAGASSLRYFGYFGARLGPTTGDHLDEVTGRTNLNWVQISDAERYAPEVLEGCTSGGCIVSTGFEFFKGCDSVHSTTCQLYPNYAARWTNLADAVRQHLDKVGAFYLMDEPQWRGATVDELETAARTIKATFPGVPVMMVEAGPQVTPSLELPSAVDWVGFDWYCQKFSAVEEKLGTLTELIEPQQSLFMVMESAPVQACGGAKGHATDADIAALQYEYLRLANANPRVIGLLAFGFWTSGFGPAQLPLTVRAHEAIWAQIPKPESPPPPPTTPPPTTEPPPPPPVNTHPERRPLPVRIIHRKVWVGKGSALAIGLSCPRASTASCSGRVSLRLLGHEPRPLGSGRFDVDPGKGSAVKVKVGRRERGSLLRRVRHGGGAKLRVHAVTAAGDSTEVVPVRAARRR